MGVGVAMGRELQNHCWGRALGPQEPPLRTRATWDRHQQTPSGSCWQRAQLMGPGGVVGLITPRMTGFQGHAACRELKWPLGSRPPQHATPEGDMAVAA